MNIKLILRFQFGHEYALIITPPPPRTGEYCKQVGLSVHITPKFIHRSIFAQVILLHKVGYYSKMIWIWNKIKSSEFFIFTKISYCLQTKYDTTEDIQRKLKACSGVIKCKPVKWGPMRIQNDGHSESLIPFWELLVYPSMLDKTGKQISVGRSFLYFYFSPI